ncbi:hypothetical protein Dsin_032921 [Dipteronia sinensis]|uniref:Uncharacterized protein n=1 Tax=Dipteronia sinensis TaxID=43782 RepID=A0AAE0DRW0_9ROSI|nr:hypothetical protein Dsin_032921 [Dipteronia sinensis]
MTVFDVERVSSLLDKWIELAVANELGGCNLEQSSAYKIRFHSLKKLELISVHIDEQMVQKFIGECFLLEDLFLSLCWHCKRIRIYHAPKLKILTIDTFSSGLSDYDDILVDVESIEIVAPSLQQCTLVIVQWSCVIDMVGCADFKHFNLTGACILDQEFHNLISKFPLLEILIVKGCFLERVSLSSNRLKELHVLKCPHLRAIDIDVPSYFTFL